MIQIHIDQEIYAKSTSYDLVSSVFFVDKEAVEEKIADLTFNHPVFNKIGSTNYIRMSSLLDWLRLSSDDVIKIDKSSLIDSNIQSLMYVMKSLIVFDGLWLNAFCSGCGKTYMYDDVSLHETKFSSDVILLLSCPRNHVLCCKQIAQFD